MQCHKPLLDGSMSYGSVRLAITCAAGILAAASAEGQSLPASFTTNITVAGNVRTVNFQAHPIRSANFQVKVQQADGSWSNYDPGPPSTYLGTVVGDSGALACATLLTNGQFWARIGFENGVEWVYFSGPSQKAYVRGNASFGISYPSSSIVTVPGGSGTNVYAAEIAVDSGWNHYNACGQDLYRTAMAVEHSILSGTYFYLRDNGILHRLGKVFIRANYDHDPYHSITSAGGKLDACRVFLSANDTTHDVGTVADSIGGGVAWVGVIGTWVRYSACGYNGGENGDFSQVWRHEVGHNWSSGDWEGGGSEGATIMNGNGLARCSGPEQNKIVGHRNSKLGILDNLGPYSFPLPPRASMDTASLYVPGSVTIDVLNNDHSGNGLAISLLTTNGTSARGGTIARSFGTGPGGRDQLVYSPPAVSPTGVDKFTYRIVDAQGRTGLGYVLVKVNPPVGLPNPADLAGNVSPWQNLSWTTFKEGSLYDVYFGTDRNAVANATTNSAAYRGRQSGLAFEPGLLASSMGYFWRIDVITDGQIITGEVWEFSTADSPLPVDLMVRLTFDTVDLAGQNGETVLDAAYPANNFLNSGALGGQPGQMGQAFLFNGTNSAVRSMAANIIPASPAATLSAWVKSTDPATGRHLLSVEGAWVIQYDGGNLVAFLDGSSSGNPVIAAGIGDGSWHHVVAANDGSTTRVYVDGLLKLSYPESIFNLSSLSRNTCVGATHDGSSLHFPGELDDVGIWTRSLSGDEVYRVYTNGLAGRFIEREMSLTRIGFEASEGFTGFATGTFSDFVIRTDIYGTTWQKLAGDVQIWNRSDIPPTGVQCLKLGDADAQCRIRFTGTTHGVGIVSFDYASYSSSGDNYLSLSYSNATSGGWVEVWSTHLTDTPWWEDKPWPTAIIPVFATGDVDLLLKKTGSKGVLLDNFRATSKTGFAPEFASNPLLKPGATAGVSYSGSIAQDVFDPLTLPGLVFTKLSGPAWLTVLPDGALSGTPAGQDYGLNQFEVLVSDASGQTGQTVLAINVAVTPDSLLAGSQPNPGYARFWAWFPPYNSSSPNGAGEDAHGAVVTRLDDVRGAFDHDLTTTSGAGGGVFRTNILNGWPAINYTGGRNNWGPATGAGAFQTLPNGYTIVVVARVNALSSTGYLFDGSSGSGRIGLRAAPGSPNRWQLHAYRNWTGLPGVDSTIATGPVTLNKFQTHTVVVSGTTASHYIDGSLAGSGTFADGGTPLPMSGLILACNASVASPMNCDIAEVLAYNEALSPASRTELEQSMLVKYGLVLPPPEPPVITPVVSGGDVVMTLPSQSGYTYILQTTTNLVEPFWTPVATNAGTGSQILFSRPRDSGRLHEYFRVLAQ